MALSIQPAGERKRRDVMTAKRILSLGQCAADEWSIGRLIAGHFDAEVTAARTAAEALAALRRTPFDLVLVNRVLDHDGSRGLDFIEQLKADEPLGEVPVMLVSNHDDAQRQAAARGAVPGFGKSALGDPETLARLRAVLGDSPDASDGSGAIQTP